MPEALPNRQHAVKPIVTALTNYIPVDSGHLAGMVTRIHKSVRGHLYLKEHREARNLSLQQMAERLDVSRETIWRWENEQHRLNPQKIAAYADALGLEPEALWRVPAKVPSLDSIVKDAPDELRAMAADIVRRLVASR